MRKFLSLIFCVLLCLSLIFSAAADSRIVIGGTDNDTWLTKYGNVNTSCTAEYFQKTLGLTWGDLVTVSFLDQTLILPVVADYSYVSSAEPAILLRQNQNGEAEGVVSLAINMDNFAQTYGLATKHTDPSGNWYWQAAEGVTFPVEVRFALYEKEGYMAQYLLHSLHRTNDREDYARLSDEAFANFREVTTTGMQKGTLYRTSSPIDPKLNRNTCADAALCAAGVKTIVNLANSRDAASQFEGFAASYYAQQNVIYLNLGVNFTSPEFKAGLAEGLIHMANNPGPYAIHCTEGKDRAGFVIALLQCFTGASYEEVAADYMLTYSNYYGVEPGSDQYDTILECNIVKSLARAFEVTDLKCADLAKEAEAYLRSAGLSDQQLAALRKNLTGQEPGVDPLWIIGFILICLCMVITILLSRRRRKTKQ